jgi:hypothetical protein
MDSLFTKVLIQEANLNPNFVALLDDHRVGTRAALDEAFRRFPERTKHFVKGFQGPSFHAAVWELYLSQCIQEHGYTLVRQKQRPDFKAEKDGRVVFFEATTTNPTRDKGPGPDLQRVLYGSPLSYEELNEHRQTYVQRLAGALESKLQKNYGALEWVEGNPVVLAVSPFHDAFALLRTDVWALQYLYGLEPIERQTGTGHVERSLERIGRRMMAGRELEFGFFDRPEAKWISAIIFSNSGTIAKFSRYAAIKGWHPESIRAVVRSGICFDPDPNAFTPRQFAYRVGEDGWDENWAQGLVVMHNPHANYPLQELFADIMEFHITEHGGLAHTEPYFHPYWSITQLISADSDAENPTSPEHFLAVERELQRLGIG